MTLKEGHILESVEVNIIDHIADKSLYFKIEFQNKGNEYIYFDIDNISLSIFGMESLNGSIIKNGKYSTGMYSDLSIKLGSHEKKQIMISFDIDEDYVKRVNKMIEGHIPIMFSIEIFKSLGLSSDRNIGLITCLYKVKKVEWLYIIYKLDYRWSIIHFINNFMIRNIYYITILIVLYYLNIFNLRNITDTIIESILKYYLKIP